MNQPSTIQQLVDIYTTSEPWHKTRMSDTDAFNYHKTRYENGSIHTYEQDGEVLGYYERYFTNTACILYNVWIKEDCRRGEVFKSLYRHFFQTMPPHISYIIGEKVKLGGKVMTAFIRRKHGKH